MAGFELAFQLFKDSTDMSKTTGCNKLILFMTDGVDASGKGNAMMREITKLQTDFGGSSGKIPIFTYAFGDELKTGDQQLAQLPKKIACQNDGIPYQVPDGEPLADVMVDYYKYFSNGLSASDPILETVRWTEYTDAWTETAKLLAGCMPVYDSTKKANGEVDLIGVTCMDMNVIVPLQGSGNNPLENRDNYNAFKLEIERQSSLCMASSHDQSSLQRMRKSHPKSSECRPCDMVDDWCEPESEDDAEGTAAAFLMGALLLLHA
jgi:hypothetical protein